MEMHQIRYVVAVARSGNFSRAAEQCHVSQPSLSQQIQKLEDELGERLFDRLKREAKLTTHGQAFLRRALRILEEVDAARREATDARELAGGTVTLGVLPTIAPYLLPPVLTQFHARHPGVEIIVQEDTTAQLLKLALACEIDFALASLPIADARFEVRELFSEEFFVALPPGHPLTGRRVLRTADIEGERFIVMKEGHCLGDQVLELLRAARCPAERHLPERAAGDRAITVCAGMGLSLIPAMAVGAGRARHPEYRSLQSPRPERKIVAFWPKQRPPGRAAEELLNVAATRPPSKNTAPR